MALDIRKLWAQKPRYRVGDRVQFTFGIRTVIGEVVEYRGPIAHGGQQLFTVQFPRSEDEISVVELPVEDLEPAP